MRGGCVAFPRERAQLSLCFRRLKDVDNSDGKLYLVFEWVDKDLKKYMDSVSGGMTMPLVKVCGGQTLFRTRRCKALDALPPSAP